jgi:hypothetical protein
MYKPTLFFRLGRAPWDLRFDFGAVSREGRAFFYRMLTAGAVVAVNTAAPIWHIDRRNGYAYAPAKPPCRVRSNRLVPVDVPAEEPYEFRTYGLPVDSKAAYQERERSGMAEVSRLRQEIQDVQTETRRNEEAIALLRRRTRESCAGIVADAICRLVMTTFKRTVP